MPFQFLPVGRASIASFVTTFRDATLCVSTIGVAPDTVMVSSTEPTRSSALMVAVNPVVSVMPSRLMLANPGSANVTVYDPGRRSTILYSPRSSVMTERTFSIRAGLEASTVTPGSTAPLVSFAEPAIAVSCAAAIPGNATETTSSTTLRNNLRIETPPSNDQGPVPTMSRPNYIERCVVRPSAEQCAENVYETGVGEATSME